MKTLATFVVSDGDDSYEWRVEQGATFTASIYRDGTAVVGESYGYVTAGQAMAYAMDRAGWNPHVLASVGRGLGITNPAETL